MCLWSKNWGSSSRSQENFWCLHGFPVISLSSCPVVGNENGSNANAIYKVKSRPCFLGSFSSEERTFPRDFRKFPMISILENVSLLETTNRDPSLENGLVFCGIFSRIFFHGKNHFWTQWIITIPEKWKRTEKQCSPAVQQCYCFRFRGNFPEIPGYHT